MLQPGKWSTLLRHTTEVGLHITTLASPTSQHGLQFTMHRCLMSQLGARSTTARNLTLFNLIQAQISQSRAMHITAHAPIVVYRVQSRPGTRTADVHALRRLQLTVLSSIAAVLLLTRPAVSRPRFLHTALLGNRVAARA